MRELAAGNVCAVSGSVGGEVMQMSDKSNYFVGIYSRLSVDAHAHKAGSIENQIEMIRQFIDENNAAADREMELTIYDIYIDRGVSGTSFERKGFERLMQDVKARKVNCIIVKDLSRFGRDYLETGDLIEKLLPFLGCRFIAVADHFDSMAADVNEGRLAMHMKNLVNDMYAKDIARKVAAAKKLSAERGAFIGSFAPYGYEVVKGQGIRQLQIHEECAGVVREIFTLYAQGAAVGDIIRRLYAERVHRISDYRRYGHAYCTALEELHQWNAGTINGMLQNADYVGDKHEAIISRQLFETVQERKAAAHPAMKEKYVNKSTENIFRNILYCGCCGKRLHAVFNRSRGSGERHYAYVCRNAYRIDDGKCEKNHIGEKKLTDICIGQLRSVFEKWQIRAEDVAELSRMEYQRRRTAYELAEKKLSGECRYRKIQAGRAYERYKAGAVGREEYAAYLQRKKEQDILAAQKLKEIRENIQKVKRRAENEERFMRALWQSGRCGVQELPSLDSRSRDIRCIDIRFIEAMIERIDVFPDGTIDIFFRFRDEQVMPMAEKETK